MTNDVDAFSKAKDDRLSLVISRLLIDLTLITCSSTEEFFSSLATTKPGHTSSPF